MIRATAQLLSQRGFAGTSFAEVLEASGAPRGSLYHHFPGGKDELLAEAVAYAGSLLVAALDAADTDDPVELMDAFTGLWRRLLTGSELSAGCAVAAVATGAPLDDLLRSVSAQVFRSWTDLLAMRLQGMGIANSDARQLAVTAIAAVEGALVVARTEGSLEPFDDVAKHLATAARHTRTSAEEA